MNTNNGNICVVHNIEQKQRSKKKKRWSFPNSGEKRQKLMKGKKVASKMNGDILCDRDVCVLMTWG